VNILFHSALPAARYGGVGRWTRRLIAALREVGHRVYVLSWGPAGAARPEGDEFSLYCALNPRLLAAPFLGFWYRLLAAARAGRALLGEAEIDAIHTLTVYEAFSASLARGSSRAGIVLSIHGDYVREQSEWWKSRWRRRLNLPLERAGLRACGCVTTSSAWLAGRLAAELRGRRVQVIPNGIDLPAESVVWPDRSALGLPVERPIVLTLNSLYAPYRRQGLKLLVEAAPLVLRRVPEALFLVVGGVNDPERDRALVAWAREQAGDLPFTFSGYRPEAPADLMAAADVYCHPSFLDNSPTAVLEAMALGRPIVATRVGGIPELVSDGETGLLVPLETSALAEALVRLLRDPACGRTLGQKARERAKTDFSWRRVGEQFAEVYRVSSSEL
jgi:glycosyltransferase involved in cell wall biosynthesis